MLYKKKGYPEEGDLIICTVKKILYHSVFVELDEYEGKEGMVHISEVSPGRIRTLSDFVKEGRKVVCKVINVDKEKGHIDLSIRRVSATDKIKKMNEYKQEQKAEKLMEFIGKKFDKDLKYMYEKVGSKAIENFGSLNSFFFEISSKGENVLEGLNIPKDIGAELVKIVKEKIKPKEVTISGTFSIINYKEDGINIIKDILSKIKNVELSYIGAPNYRVVVKSNDYKDAENKLKIAVESVLTNIKKTGGEGKFTRNG